MKTADLPAPVSRVWRALTDFREFGDWFRVRVDDPFAEDQMSSGHMTYPGYEHLKWEVIVQRIEPESEFSFTWHPYAVDPSVNYSAETPTLVCFRLQPVRDGCRLTVTESGFDKIPSARRAEAFRMNDEGWSIQMENIRDYLTGNR